MLRQNFAVVDGGCTVEVQPCTQFVVHISVIQLGCGETSTLLTRQVVQAETTNLTKTSDQERGSEEIDWICGTTN
jgi:hypothetical protein